MKNFLFKSVIYIALVFMSVQFTACKHEDSLTSLTSNNLSTSKEVLADPDFVKLMTLQDEIANRIAAKSKSMNSVELTASLKTLSTDTEQSQQKIELEGFKDIKEYNLFSGLEGYFTEKIKQKVHDNNIIKEAINQYLQNKTLTNQQKVARTSDLGTCLNNCAIQDGFCTDYYGNQFRNSKFLCNLQKVGRDIKCYSYTTTGPGWITIGSWSVYINEPTTFTITDYNCLNSSNDTFNACMIPVAYYSYKLYECYNNRVYCNARCYNQFPPN